MRWASFLEERYSEEQEHGRIGTRSYSLMKGEQLVAMMTLPSPEDLDLSDIFAFVDQHRQEFLDRLIDYVRRPSISAYGQGIGEVAEYIAGVMNQLGLQARIMPTAGWPMVLGARTERPGAPTVLLYGHYDVQPPDPLEAWTSPPFDPTIRDGRLYARGVGDNKGQHFAQLMALETLLACRSTLPCNIKVLLEGEEEIGSPHMAPFITAHREELMADLVITSDGPVHESGRSLVVFGVRGVLTFELRARGANRDLHSGNWGGIAPDPLWTLVHLLATMKNERSVVTIEGFYDNVKPLTDLERQAIARLPNEIEEVKRNLGLQRLDQPLDRGLAERLCAWPTFTINGLLGGSLPDYVFTKILGIPAFTVPYANADESNHAPNENLEVERFFRGIKTGA